MSSVEQLFIPGQNLAHEAQTVIEHLRNYGARLNRLKLARAAPDAPIWWQFLSTSDGSAEALDKAALEIQQTLRELEQATSELKRLCVAPASDVAGNVQHEMQKKKWAISTLDRWRNVIKNATHSRAEATETAHTQKLKQQIEEENQKLLAARKQQQQGGSANVAAAASGSNPFLVQVAAEDGDERALIHLSKEGTTTTTTSSSSSVVAAADSKSEQQAAAQKKVFAVTPHRQQLIRAALESQDRISNLQDELEKTESSCSAALKLASKFRELDLIETRFNNLKTRRRQFEDQVKAHLSEIGIEIEKEANTRRKKAREFYEESEESQRRKRQQQQQQAEQASSLGRSKKQQKLLAFVQDPKAANNNQQISEGGESTEQKQQNQDQLTGDGLIFGFANDPALCCDDCAGDLIEAQRLEKERKKLWVNRAVRVLCTQAVDPQNLKAESRSVVPSHRLLAVVGSKIEGDGAPVCVKPLLSRKVTKHGVASASSSASGSMSFDLLPERNQDQNNNNNNNNNNAIARTAIWNIPSAHDHSRSWNLRLSI